MSTLVKKTLKVTLIDAKRRVVSLAGSGMSRGRQFPIGVNCFVPDRDLFEQLEKSVSVGDVISVEMDANTSGNPAPMKLHWFDLVSSEAAA